MEYRPSKTTSAFGLAVGVIFVLIGLFIVIPQFGAFGFFWTLIALVITVMNGVNAFSEKGVPTGEIRFEDEGEPSVPTVIVSPPQPSAPRRARTGAEFRSRWAGLVWQWRLSDLT